MAEDKDTFAERIEQDGIGAALASMVLIGFSVFVSHITTGLLLANPCPDFGSTTTPFAAALGISPTGSSVSRLKTVIRRGFLRGMYNWRASTSAKAVSKVPSPPIL